MHTCKLLYLLSHFSAVDSDFFLFLIFVPADDTKKHAVLLYDINAQRRYCK